MLWPCPSSRRLVVSWMVRGGRPPTRAAVRSAAWSIISATPTRGLRRKRVIRISPALLPPSARTLTPTRPPSSRRFRRKAPLYGWPAPHRTALLGFQGGRHEGRSGAMTIAVLGIDLGKNSCSLVGLDAGGRVVLRRRMRRETVIAFGAKLTPCVVAMEACCGAHHMGRALAAQGHTVRLMSPEYVRPYVKAHKNDDRDAEAIAEAATRPTMRFVPLKPQDQLDVQTLHRVRSRLVGMRTMLVNQLRAILLERGFAFAQGRRNF